MSEDYALGNVEVAQSPEARYKEFLQSRGKRITQQRQIIVEHVFSHHEHFDADGLLDELGKHVSDRKVSRPTVYRTLSELVDAGLLRKMSLNGRAVYEHDYGYPQHDHLHCVKCNRLIEFKIAALQKSVDELGRRAQSAPQDRVVDLAVEHAVRLAKRGASVEVLTRDCGLNIGEAELLHRLHGKQPDATPTARSA